MSVALMDQQILQEFLDHMDDFFILLDEQFCLVYANQSARGFFNLTPADFSQSFFQIFKPWPNLTKLLSDTNTIPKVSLEVEIEDETVMDVHIVQNKHDYLISMHDVSRYTHRNRLREEFVRTLSHDLRSPLTAILGYVELIDRVGELNEMQRDFMQRVINSVQHINTLIDDLLNLARFEIGDEINKEEVWLNQLVHDAARDYYKKILDRGQDLQMNVTDERLSVFGNRSQLRLLLEKLLNNAINYTNTGGKITFSCSAENDKIILQISDTGIGIPTDEQNLIFSRFFRGSNIGGRILGSGLGLAIAHSIVQNHGGQIFVESKLNSGSTFTVIMPRMQS